MSGTLLKGSSDAARRATLRLAFGQDDVAPEPPPPSAEALEITRLGAENAALVERLREVEDERERAIEAARGEAYQEAADRHVRDDARIAEALSCALADAKDQFGAFMDQASAPMAKTVAAAAMGKLVRLREQDEDWLGRLIAHRLESVAQRAGIRIALAPGELPEAVECALQTIGRAGTEIKIDPSIAPGDARIMLELGEIEIDPARGREAIMALLASGDE